jgi:formate dehydrogenase major subunit
MSSNPIDRGAPAAPVTVRAPGGADAGGPKQSSTPPAGGSYSQGPKSGGEAGVVPTGRINAKNQTNPGLVFELDGVQVEAGPGETIWAVAQRLGTHIPHL